MPRLGALAAVLALCAGGAAAEALSPVQKVITLLEDNKGKIVLDMAAEEKEMTEYAEFCDTESEEKGFAIRDAARKISELEAEISDGESQVAAFEDEIATLGTEVAGKEKQLDEASIIREKAKDAFKTNEEELITSVDELERAVAVVKKDAALLQTATGAKLTDARKARKGIKAAMTAISAVIDASWVNTEKRKALKGLLQTGLADKEGDDLKLGAPEAAAYESSTGGIVSTLEDMKEKAEEALADARDAEKRQQHTFDMQSQSLTDAMANAKERLGEAKSNMASELEAAGKANSELMETKKTKKADEKYVASLVKECDDTKQAWAERQASAKEEMAVIAKAQGILGDRVKVFVQTGNKLVAAAHGDVDAAVETPASRQAAAKRQRLLGKLRDLSTKFKSYALMEMVSAASAGPFEKIRGLVEGMVAKLLNEANEEATQKSFCDEEMSKSKASKDEKNVKVDTLQARLDKAMATKAGLENLVKELEAEVAALDKGDAEATTIRNEEHKTYLVNSKDFKDAAEAVTEAIQVLKEYYEGALVQTGSKIAAQAPQFGGAKSDAATVILSILEMSAEDFTKMYMQAEQEEFEAKFAYEKLMDENKVSKAAKQAESKASQSEVKSLDVAIKNGGGDVAIVSKELEAVMEYMDKLKPQCETKVMSYAEQKSRREAEIEGLKEALSIVEGEAPALLQTPKRLRSPA